MLTAIAIVPLLEIRMKVMIAIRISGMCWPNTVSANTSLGLGHGTVDDMRTCMYEVRKQLNMKVSDSRNIHIIALPHGTTKACLSDAKSVATPGRPGVPPAGCTTLVAISAICVPALGFR